MALLGKFAKSHLKDIAKAQRWIDSAQAQFASAIEEAMIAETHFDKVVADQTAKAKAIAEKAEKELSEIDSIITETSTKKAQATAFKNKIQSFFE